MSSQQQPQYGQYQSYQPPQGQPPCPQPAGYYSQYPEYYIQGPQGPQGQVLMSQYQYYYDPQQQVGQSPQMAQVPHQMTGQMNQLPSQINQMPSQLPSQMNQMNQLPGQMNQMNQMNQPPNQEYVYPQYPQYYYAAVQTPALAVPKTSNLSPATVQRPETLEPSKSVERLVVTDHTGQTQPPGSNFKVTTTLWEDEGTLCYQTEARGVCVARRADNNFVNGTKLLNVAGMTRGRRDGLLKGEANRHVVKAGAMHLKGVWIPYDRALEYANKEKIVDLLYPLFVTDLKSLLSKQKTGSNIELSTEYVPAMKNEVNEVNESGDKLVG